MGHGVIVHGQDLLCFRNPKSLFDCYTLQAWPYRSETSGRKTVAYLLQTTGIADCLGIGFRLFVSGEVVAHGLYHSASEHSLNSMREASTTGLAAFFASLSELAHKYQNSHVEIYTHQGSSDKYELRSGESFECMLGEVLPGVKLQHQRLKITPSMAMQVAKNAAHCPMQIKPDVIALLLLRTAALTPRVKGRSRARLLYAIEHYLLSVMRVQNHKTSLRAVSESVEALEQGAIASEGVWLLLRRKTGFRFTVFAGARYQALLDSGFERDLVRALYYDQRVAR